MSTDTRGLYETLITEALAARLSDLDRGYEAVYDDLRTADAADRIALHLNRVVRWAVQSLPERDRASKGIELARDLVVRIESALSDGSGGDDAPIEEGRILRAIAKRLPDGTPERIEGPLIPLLDTTLLTNSPGEPRVGSQILTEIHSADRVDVVMAFVRKSGMRPMLGALRKHCADGRALRVLTTTYTGSTELAALELLTELGAEVRVSYDTTITRLHAKAWLFHRQSGFSTAYIGSSNLTHSAQISGLEWNVRMSGARNPDVIEKVGAVFESYWNGGDFVPFDHKEFLKRLPTQGNAPTVFISPIELRPEPFQERLLEQIALARQQGRHRNLLVSATGTGKTVMAAIDYLRLRSTLPRSRLLFVAHRSEILEQSRATFCQGLRDNAFGELWVGGKRPQDFDHVFASVQSLNAADLSHLAPDHFDVVVVDEFHHAAADSYRKLLEHVRPRELLGLTATPERSDGLSILEHFDGRIAAELRLWDAIDQHRLTPFLYYGVSDGLDLRDVPWRRGRGYDIDGLTNVLTANDASARLVLRQLAEHVDDLSKIRCLGFCVSVAHARFMARVFREAGVAAVAVWGSSPTSEREAALRELAAGRVQVVFSVDLFNEGIDVPAVDTVLFLRPTDSPTLFLQQLGRGLRRMEGKSACTVLDFVGQHRREFRFDRRFRALLGGTRKRLVSWIESGFPFLPAGCHMELDPVATERVLENVRAAVPSTWNAKAEELRQVAAASQAGDVTLGGFLEEAGLELEDVYAGNRGWSDLRGQAGLPVKSEGPEEVKLRRACGRLRHVDDVERIEGYRALLANEVAPDPDRLSERERRLLRMLVASVADQAVSKRTTLAAGTDLLWRHPQVRAELDELLAVLHTRVDHVGFSLGTHPDVPLRIHARYTRLEIFGAFGEGGEGARIPAWQTGVYRAEPASADLFAFTLDKTSGGFSPTTRYRDYAISRELIHWESQGATRADSETGLRYREHAARGSSIFLFARLNTDDRAFWFLGPATYVSHESERPLQIVWRLRHPLPGDLFAAFAAAVA